MPSPLTLPVRYTTHQPPLGANIRASHPLARGLVSFLACNEGAGSPRDAVTRLALAPNGQAGWAASPAGRALDCSKAADSGYTVTCPAALRLQTLTLVWYGVLKGPATSGAVLGGVTYGSTDSSPWLSYTVTSNGGNALRCWYNTGGYGDIVAGSLAYGVPTLVAFTFTSGAQTCWVGGVQVGAGSAAGTIAYSASALYTAGMYVPGAGRTSNCLVLAQSVYDRVLQPAEIRGLRLAPYCMFG